MLQEQTYIPNNFRHQISAPISLHPGIDSHVAAIASWLLVLALPFTVLWIPIIRIPGTGTLTILDVLLLLLWGTTLLLLGRRSRMSGGEKQAFRIVIYGFAPAFFACLGGWLYNSDSLMIPEFLQHAKRFGFAAIIPLAMLMSSPRLVRRIRVAAVASLALMVGIPYTPWVSLLPINDLANRINEGAIEIRGSGTLSNPNDYAYIALLVALIGLSHAAGRRASGLSQKVLAVTAVLIGLTGIITSASRSGMTAALVAAAYMVAHSKLSSLKKLSLVIILGATMFIGWRASAVYQNRMESAIANKTLDSSAVARLDAQAVALQTWLHHPLGVGFLNMATATQEFSSNSQFFTSVTGSDSIYFDHLLGSGLFGFLCIIFCFRNCWKLVRFRPLPIEAGYLKAGMLAAFVFGTATISPASVFVGPFFFTVVGLAACIERDSAVMRLNRAA